jgi:hypothetical protein
MAQGFSLIPEDAPPVTEVDNASIYRQLLADALTKFEQIPRSIASGSEFPPARSS